MEDAQGKILLIVPKGIEINGINEGYDTFVTFNRTERNWNFSSKPNTL